MLGDHFMWISWAPFRAQSWEKLTTSTEIREAVLAEAPRALGTSDPVEAEELLKEDVVQDLAERLWLVVMSEKQERLVPLDDWRGVVARYYNSNGGSSW